MVVPYPALSFAGRDGGPLVGKQLVEHYKGEDKSLGWRTDLERWAENNQLDPADPAVREQWEQRRDGDSTTTRYDTDPVVREKSRLKEKDKGEYKGEGDFRRKTNVKVKASHDRRDHNNAEEFGWVMSPETGAIHTFDDTNHQKLPNGKTKTMHHSSPLAGGKVAGAGMMTVEDKHITQVTDESGHYRPEGEYTYQAVKQMADRGLLERKADRWDRDEHESGEGSLSAKVTLAGAEGRDGRPGKGWLADEGGIFTGNLTLPYQAFLQTRGNERQARAKVSMQQELLGKVPEIAPVAEGQGRRALDDKGRVAASALGPAQSQESSAPTSSGYADLDQVLSGAGGVEPVQSSGPGSYEEYDPAVHSGSYVADDQIPDVESTSTPTADPGEMVGKLPLFI